MALDTTIGGTSSDAYDAWATFVTYSTSMGWTLLGDQTSQEADLRRATVYLDREFVFVGYRVNEDQALAWPRYAYDLDPDGYQIPSDSIPTPIKHAMFEVAYLFNQGNDLLGFTAGAAVKKETKKLDVLEKTTEYETGSDTQPRVLSIEGLLRGYITSAVTGKTSGMIPRLRG